MPDAPPQAAALVCEKVRAAGRSQRLRHPADAAIGHRGHLACGQERGAGACGALAPNLYLFLLSWLFVFTFSLALNLLSFSVAPRWLVPALLTVLFILILQMRIAMKSKTGWQWNPAIHFYLNCHAEFLSFAWQASEEAAEALLPGLKVWHSLAYFSALDAALFALGYWRARRLEFGLLLED